MSVHVINDEDQFQTELTEAEVRLVVADFTAPWCGPCQRIAPDYELLPNKYPKAVFLKVDVDKCQATAVSQEVSALPTFIYYKNKKEIDRMEGADITALESKIQEHIGSSISSEDEADSEAEVEAEAEAEAEAETDEEYGQGLMDLNNFILKQECECLNESDDHCMTHCLTSTGGFLQSDSDEQLIMSITFNQAVKIHSIKIKAPPHMGPKEIKLFINHPTTIDFDMAESMTSVQDVTLDASDLLNGQPVTLRYVKFQNVQNIQIFVRNNQTGGEVTQIDFLAFIGSPLMTTKMTEFKRVAGKKGESH